MFLLAVELHTVRPIARLASGSRSDAHQLFTKTILMSDPSYNFFLSVQEGIRASLIEKRATIVNIDHRISVQNERTKAQIRQPEAPMQRGSSEYGSSTSVIPSGLDGWSDVGRQTQSPTKCQSEKLHIHMFLTDRQARKSEYLSHIYKLKNYFKGTFKPLVAT